jgi:TolA-binding protein
MQKNLFVLLLLLTFVFIGCGDQFLPQPLSGASLKTRTAFNQWAAGLQFWQPKVNPNQRTEREIDQMQNNRQPNDR